MPTGIYIRTKTVGGWKLSLETRQKMSIAKTGVKHGGKRVLSDATKAKIGKSAKGRRHSEETKLQIGIASRNRIHPKRSEELKLRHKIWNINNPNRKFKDTKIELIMKELLTSLGVYYLFQQPIENIAIVDFYIPEKKLIIECDGCYWHGCNVHYPSRSFIQEKDSTRDSKLQSLGYKVIRFWEHEINSMSLIKLE